MSRPSIAGLHERALRFDCYHKGMDPFFEEMQRLRNAVEVNKVYDTLCPDDWNTLCSSMDALEDTHHAISAFVVTATRLRPDLQERELGERYLRAYGVMQAFIIQQDAIRHVYISLGLNKPDLSTLSGIRDLRHAAAGHPTLQDRPKPQRSHFISQITLGDNGMELLTVDGSGQPAFRNIEVPKLADQQQKLILGLIHQAVAHLT
jgi:hypothetical protein